MKNLVIILLLAAGILAAQLTGLLTTAQPSAASDDAAFEILDPGTWSTASRNGLETDTLRAFKRTMKERMRIVESRIAGSWARIAKEQDRSNAGQVTRLATVEKHYQEMKRKLDDYPARSDIAWESFRTVTIREIDTLEKSIANVFTLHMSNELTR
ncbi:MAG: hypothetical protein IPP94_03550 [Ignavibacteria bacterium]|nr:hypothetical protein [Ignavibacteria bacterium]